LHEWTDAEKTVISELESDLGTAEMGAVLSEWVAANVHRVFAATAVLGAWRSQLLLHGYPETVADSSLALIMDRLWPSKNSGHGLPLDDLLDRVSDQVTRIILDDAEDWDDDETED
jgi:hypothetical protein